MKIRRLGGKKLGSNFEKVRNVNSDVKNLRLALA
jgi:hypothetical protein